MAVVGRKPFAIPVKRFTATLVAVMLSATLLAQSYNEAEVKAAFLFHFAHYMEYPSGAFENDKSPFVIGVLSKSPVTDALQKVVRGKNVNGRSIVIRQLGMDKELRKCHILFIPKDEADKLPAILEILADAPVLTVGESANFASKGGIMGFFTEQNRIRFEINPDSARRAHLIISSKLLSLARIVGEGRRS